MAADSVGAAAVGEFVHVSAKFPHRVGVAMKVSGRQIAAVFTNYGFIIIVLKSG